MSEARNVDIDDQLTLEQLIAAGAVRLPTVGDRTFADVEVFRIDGSSLDVVEDVRG